jgi:flagellar basal body-associated protein FliL
MAKEAPKPEQNPAATTPAPAADVAEAGPPKSYRLYMILGFVSLILFQMIVLFLVVLALPTGQTSPEEGLRVTDGPGTYDGPSATTGPPVVRQRDAVVERLIGTFTVKHVRNEANESLALTMHVTIRQGREARNFDIRFEACKQQIIDRVTNILNVSTPAERSEAGNTTLKERSKRAINEVLGTPWVQEVLISDFKYETN